MNVLVQSPIANRTDCGACPSFFKACCVEAARGQTHDGVRVGYDHPGYHLTVHHPAPYEIENDRWEELIEELIDYIQVQDAERILDWYCRWFPRCMTLVPRRRRSTFLRGVYRGAIRNGWIDEISQ